MSFNPDGGGAISTATDVAMNNPQDSQVLGYDATSSKWQNTTGSGASNIEDVEGLTAALDGKADIEHSHTVGLSSLPAGIVFQVLRVGSDWTYGGNIVTARPTARTDLHMHAIGGSVPPPFGIEGDIWDEDLTL